MTFMKRGFLPVCLALCLFPAPVRAAADADSFPHRPGDAIVEELSAAALKRLQADAAAFLPAPAPATIELPMEDRRRAAARGAVSAYAAWCGLDWQMQSFMPYMVGERFRDAWNDDQANYATLIHSLSMDRSLSALKEEGADCAAKDREAVAPYLYERPEGDVQAGTPEEEGSSGND